MAADFTKTYWDNNGKYQSMISSLQKLIPASGRVPGSKNKALERLRVAINCYYDLYNNGLCNRAASFAKIFGFSGRGHLYQSIVDRTDAKMDEIVLAAYREQSCNLIIETDGTQWGHWKGAAFKPCSRFHPGQLVEIATKLLIGTGKAITTCK